MTKVRTIYLAIYEVIHKANPGSYMYIFFLFM